MLDITDTKLAKHRFLLLVVKLGFISNSRASCSARIRNDPISLPRTSGRPQCWRSWGGTRKKRLKKDIIIIYTDVVISVTMKWYLFTYLLFYLCVPVGTVIRQRVAHSLAWDHSEQCASSEDVSVLSESVITRSTTTLSTTVTTNCLSCIQQHCLQNIRLHVNYAAKCNNM